MSEVRALSDMQQSILVHEAIAGIPAYNMPLCFKLTGLLNPDALEQALHYVIRRHPILQMRYMDDGAVPISADAALPPLERECASEADGQALELVTDFCNVPFDLRQHAPIRSMLLTVAEQEHYLVLSVHHVAGDSWSFSLLLQDLGHAYARYAAGTPSTADVTAPDFFEYAAWEQARSWDTHWWQERLEGLSPQPYPCPEPVIEAECGLSIPVELALDSAATQGVRRLARAQRVSPTVVLFAAVCSTVSSDDPQRDAVVGLPAALRDSQTSQAMMGPLLNTLPVRVGRVVGSPTTVLQTHADAIEQSLAHKDVPLSQILRAARIRRVARSAPLFLHLVNIDTEVPRLQLVKLRCKYIPIAPRWANFPAIWEFSWGAVGNLTGVLRVSTDAFTAEYAGELATAFGVNLNAILRGN